MVIDDAKGSRFVLVTADLIGFTREITDEIATRVNRKYKLERRQILFNASHTHSGPSIWPRLHVVRSADADVERQLKGYADKLTRVLKRRSAARSKACSRHGSNSLKRKRLWQMVPSSRREVTGVF